MPYWIRIRLKYYLKRLSIYFKKVSENVVAVKIVKSVNGNEAFIEDHLGVLMKLDLRNYVDQCIYKTGYFERSSSIFVENYIKSGMVCLDVGANFGYYTLKMSKLVGGEGKVIAFEPSSVFFSRLSENILLNGSNNIETIQKGMSNFPQSLQLSVGSQSATMHWLTDFSEPNPIQESIELITLDEFASSSNIKRLDFIKIDIDGHEIFVLKGGIKTIKRLKPLILLEVSHIHYREANVDIIEFYNFIIYELNYKILLVNEKEVSNLEEFLIKCCDFSHSENILLKPKY